MEQSEFDEFLVQARQVGQVLKTVYKEVTGEELELETAVRHYPLLALGLAASVGAATGWWFGRRNRQALPPPETGTPQLQGTQAASGGSTSDRLQRLMPMVERARRAVPDEVVDDASQAARSWMDTVLEPKLKKGLDSMAANLNDSRLGNMLKQAVQRAESTEEVQLEDPPEADDLEPES